MLHAQLRCENWVLPHYFGIHVATHVVHRVPSTHKLPWVMLSWQHAYVADLRKTAESIAQRTSSNAWEAFCSSATSWLASATEARRAAMTSLVSVLISAHVYVCAQHSSLNIANVAMTTPSAHWQDRHQDQ